MNNFYNVYDTTGHIVRGNFKRGEMPIHFCV